MSGIPPVVRHMILCDAYRAHPVDPSKLDLIGVHWSVEASGVPPFPFRSPEFLVFVRTSGGRGTGRCDIVIRHADTRKEIYRSAELPFVFPANPLAVMDLPIPVSGCVFPRPGLYIIYFRFEGAFLAQEPLLVR